jgi:hypothetical protein
LLADRIGFPARYRQKHVRDLFSAMWKVLAPRASRR